MHIRWYGHRGGHEARNASREVDDIATAVVDRTFLRPPAAAPDQEGVDDVDAGDPERDEDQPCLEVRALYDGADEEQWRDRREDELEPDDRRSRDVEG